MTRPATHPPDARAIATHFSLWPASVHLAIIALKVIAMQTIVHPARTIRTAAAAEVSARYYISKDG